MNLITKLIEEGFGLTIISSETGVRIISLHRAVISNTPLKEKDMRKVEAYAAKVGINPYAD